MTTEARVTFDKIDDLVQAFRRSEQGREVELQPAGFRRPHCGHDARIQPVQVNGQEHRLAAHKIRQVIQESAVRGHGLLPEDGFHLRALADKAVLFPRNVPNPDLKLMPGMTANVTVLIDRKNTVLRVPNLALRFTPPNLSDDEKKKLLSTLDNAPGQNDSSKQKQCEARVRIAQCALDRGGQGADASRCAALRQRQVADDDLG